MAGELQLGPAGLAPPLAWKIAVRTERPREREITLSLDAPDFRLRAESRLDPAGEGTWRVTEAEVKLDNWYGWIAPDFLPSFGSVSMAGILQFRGELSWRDHQLGGHLLVSLREGRIDDPAHKLLLEGVSVDVEVSDLAGPRTDPAQVFTWRSGRYDIVELGVGRIEFALEGEQIRVNEAAIDVFGGELRVPSLVMSTRKPEFSVIATMVGVDVEKMLFMLPAVLAEAHGKLDGNVSLTRDASGIKIGKGGFKLREGETADLRLAVKPGWLSTSLPPEIVKYFPGFQKMERGEIPIRARTLEVTLTPQGDAEGRTAWVHLAGGPSDPELTAPLDAKINVRGPLDELVKIGAELGTDSRLKFGAPR